MIERNARVAAITAIVHSADGVRFVTTGACPEAVVPRLADYVRERCDYVLWADASRQVRAMLDAGNLFAAITLYFERVGERWDDECLEMEPVRPDRAGAAHTETMADAR